MAEIIKQELNIEEFEIKEEIVSFKEEILPSFTVEAKCTVNLHKDDIKMANTGIYKVNSIISHCHKRISKMFKSPKNSI